MSLPEFYQLGGYRGHLGGAPETIVAKLPMSEDGFELVLGIIPCGASYLLMPENRLRRETGRKNWPRNLSRPHSAKRFASLSPIHFANAASLQKKLKALAPKANKKQRDRDTSQANSRYTASGEQESSEGLSRAAFEHQRLFVALRLKELRERDYPDYALQPVPWLYDTQIVSFAYNTWSVDSRMLQERRRDPKVLDVGWTVWSFVSDTKELRAESTTHLSIEEHQYYQNPGTKRAVFQHGQTESASLTDLCTHLQELFPLGSNTPKVLLVHNAEETLAVLNAFGVYTSRWQTGITNILYFDSSNTRASRGVSPFRQSGRDPRSRPRSPAQSPTPVYIVDIRELYIRMVQYIPRDSTIAANAADLKVGDSPSKGTAAGSGPQNSWCAGNECRLLARMWFAMARGPSIDEQYELRRGNAIKLEDEQNQPNLDDSDADPNDMVLPPGNSTSAAAASNDTYAAPSDEDDW